MFNRRQFATVATSAFAAFGLTLAVFWSTPIQAVNDAPAAAMIAAPTFHAGNCDVTAHLVANNNILGTKDLLTYLTPGAAPKMQIVIRNTTHAPAQATFQLALQQTTIRDMISRVPRMQAPAWSDDYNISLAPDETKTLDVDCAGVKTAANDSLALNISDPPAPTQLLTPNSAGAAPGSSTANGPQTGAPMNFALINMPRTTLIAMAVRAIPADVPAAVAPTSPKVLTASAQMTK